MSILFSTATDLPVVVAKTCSTTDTHFRTCCSVCVCGYQSRKRYSSLFIRLFFRYVTVFENFFTWIPFELEL